MMAVDYLCNAFTPDRVAVWKEATAGLALKIRAEVVTPGALDGFTEAGFAPKLKRFRDDRNAR